MQSKMKMGAAAGLSALLGLASAASASFIPVLTSVTPVGPNFSFNYDLVFTTNSGPIERLDSSQNPIADFATIYDIPGFVSASAGAGFSVSTANLGITATGTAPTDNPAQLNVSFSYTGANVLADTTFSGFSIVSSFGGTTNNGQYTSETTRNGGPLDGTATGHIGLVQKPIPEPTSIMVLGSLAALALLRRR